MTTLFCFGVGFSALETARALKNEGWQISGTARSEEKCRRLEAEGFTMARFDGEGLVKRSRRSSKRQRIS